MTDTTTITPEERQGCPERRRSALTWTTEPPKVAGWYFLREQGKTIPWRNHGVVSVYFDEKTQLLQIRGFGRSTGGARNYGFAGYATQWAGPIPEPKE